MVRWKNFTVMRHKFLLVTVKEWLKSVKTVLNYRSYPKKNWVSGFWITLYNIFGGSHGSITCERSGKRSGAVSGKKNCRSKSAPP